MFAGLLLVLAHGNRAERIAAAVGLTTLVALVVAAGRPRGKMV
jgi:hypothetical protein